MKVVYMAAPVSGDVDANIARAKRWFHWIESTHPVALVAPWITAVQVFDDNDPEQRAAGLVRDLAVLERCDEVWLCGGRISHGMEVESAHARQHGIPVVSLVDLGDEPPKAAA